MNFEIVQIQLTNKLVRACNAVNTIITGSVKPMTNPLIVLHNFAARAGAANKSGTTKSRIQATSMRTKLRSEIIADNIVATTPDTEAVNCFKMGTRSVAPATNGPKT